MSINSFKTVAEHVANIHLADRGHMSRCWLNNIIVLIWSQQRRITHTHTPLWFSCWPLGSSPDCSSSGGSCSSLLNSTDGTDGVVCSNTMLCTIVSSAPQKSQISKTWLQSLGCFSWWQSKLYNDHVTVLEASLCCIFLHASYLQDKYVFKKINLTCEKWKCKSTVSLYTALVQYDHYCMAFKDVQYGWTD